MFTVHNIWGIIRSEVIDLNKNLNNCPVCSGELIITGYRCPNCATEINGYFENDKFSKLSKEDRDFIEVFVMNRGSIKDIEKALGVSYPTVRNKLDGVIKALGHQVNSESSRLEILSMINDGQISAEDGAKLLKELE